MCVLEERIADLGLEIESSVPLFVNTAGSAVVYSDTSWGTNCVQKGEKFTENPLVKAEVIHYKLILTLIRHECIPVPVVGTPLMDDLPARHLFQN